MRLNHLAIILGFATASVVSTQLSVQAQTKNYQIQSGTTSLSIDKTLLQSIGLNFNSAVDTATPAPGFDFGFGIIPPSSDAGVVGSDFTFSYDNATRAYAPVSGTIEHTGSLVFDVDTTKLALLSPLQIGDFSIGFDDDGLFVRDTFSTGLRVFDLKTNNAPVFDGRNLQLTGADVLVSQEFSNALSYAGSGLDLTGLKVGQAQISATAVPEPEANAAMAALITAGVAVAMKKRRAALKKDASLVKADS